MRADPQHWRSMDLSSVIRGCYFGGAADISARIPPRHRISFQVPAAKNKSFDTRRESGYCAS
ncbi:MAG: hypothetical protein N3D71_13345, partial [Burkholderiaceae bacterium]|nr:hypothetical protein [Burkholderiaceae bacterium]